MATPSLSESAWAILMIFARKHICSGGTLPAGAVNDAFLTNPRFSPSDYDAGLKCALRKKWLAIDGESIRLTEVGFHEL